MPLVIYRDFPFTPGNQVDEDDFFTGDGVTVGFTLARKTVSRLAATVEFDLRQYYQYNGGFTRTAQGFQTDSPPPQGSQGVAPGLTTVLFDQLFDQAVPGVINPNVQEIPFYLADSTDIPLKEYHSPPDVIGIQLTFVDMISSATAATSWIQLASATQDAPGLPLGYGATGAPLYTADISTFGTLLASSAAGASSLLVDNASSFLLGDYILINGGNPTQEITKVIQYTPSNTLGVVGTTFKHLAGEPVYTCGRKFWAKCTVPLGITGGDPQNYYNLSLRAYFARRSRV